MLEWSKEKLSASSAPKVGLVTQVVKMLRIDWLATLECKSLTLWGHMGKWLSLKTVNTKENAIQKSSG